MFNKRWQARVKRGRRQANRTRLGESSPCCYCRRRCYYCPSPHCAGRRGGGEGSLLFIARYGCYGSSHVHYLMFACFCCLSFARVGCCRRANKELQAGHHCVKCGAVLIVPNIVCSLCVYETKCTCGWWAFRLLPVSSRLLCYDDISSGSGICMSMRYTWAKWVCFMVVLPVLTAHFGDLKEVQ